MECVDIDKEYSGGEEGEMKELKEMDEIKKWKWGHR